MADRQKVNSLIEKLDLKTPKDFRKVTWDSGWEPPSFVTEVDGIKVEIHKTTGDPRNIVVDYFIQVAGINAYHREFPEIEAVYNKVRVDYEKFEKSIIE